jgi:ribose-phosphate pyrophosphokinase
MTKKAKFVIVASSWLWYTINMLVIAGSHPHPLAKALAEGLGAAYYVCASERFADGERQICIPHSVLTAASELLIVQSLISQHFAEQWLELCLLLETLSQCLTGVVRVRLLLPYIAYTRNRHAMAYIVRSLQHYTYLQQIISIDLHQPLITAFAGTPWINLLPSRLWQTEYMANSNELVFIAPDRGAWMRTSAMGKLFAATVVLLHKERSEDGQLQLQLSGVGTEHSLVGRHCVIIDDMLVSGRTIQAAVQYLRQRGAARVDACVSHAVAACVAAPWPGALVGIGSICGLQQLYLTDSIALPASLPERSSPGLAVRSLLPVLLDFLQ